MYYPDVRKMTLSSTDGSKRLEVEATQEHNAWVGRALRMSSGRLLRAPGDSSTTAPSIEQLELQAQSYKELVDRFTEFCKADLGDDVKVFDSDQVNSRIQDWQQRIHDLYAWVSDRIGASYELKATDEVEMNEELMRDYHLRPIMSSTLRVSRRGRLLLLFKPKGLWIVGANGRIDLMGSTSTYFLVDHAEYGLPARWMLYSSSSQHSEQFTIEVLMGVLGDERI